MITEIKYETIIIKSVTSNYRNLTIWKENNIMTILPICVASLQKGPHVAIYQSRDTIDCKV